jgi:hypothetical protein
MMGRSQPISGTKPADPAFLQDLAEVPSYEPPRIALLQLSEWHFVRPLFNISALFEPRGSEN